MTNAAYDKIMLAEIKNTFSFGHRKATIGWKESEVIKTLEEKHQNIGQTSKSFYLK